MRRRYLIWDLSINRVDNNIDHSLDQLKLTIAESLIDKVTGSVPRRLSFYTHNFTVLHRFRWLTPHFEGNHNIFLSDTILLKTQKFKIFMNMACMPPVPAEFCYIFFLYKHHILGILPYWPHEGPVIIISFLKEFIFPFIWNWSAFYDHFIFGWRICPLFSPPYTLNSHWRWYRHWFPCIFASCSMKRWNTPRKHVIYILNYIIISNLYVQTAS